jgi:hypothetical protein
MSPPRPFRLVYRSFDEITFDPTKSDEIFELRGFDLAYVSRMFPGMVLERADTRSYSDSAIRPSAMCRARCFSSSITRRGGACRLITAWIAEPHERTLWYDLRH